MMINVSVLQCTGGLPPDIILLTLCDSIGEPFPPKPFDELEGLDAFRFFFKYIQPRLHLRGLFGRLVLVKLLEYSTILTFLF